VFENKQKVFIEGITKPINKTKPAPTYRKVYFGHKCLCALD